MPGSIILTESSLLGNALCCGVSSASGPIVLEDDGDSPAKCQDPLTK